MPAFFAWCEAHGAAVVVAGDRDAQAEAVQRACAFKAAVVGDDEREEKPNDGRALLNLGHTFGHALEAEFGYTARCCMARRWRSAWGWPSGCRRGWGLCARADAERVVAHLAAVGPAGRSAAC